MSALTGTLLVPLTNSLSAPHTYSARHVVVLSGVLGVGQRREPVEEALVEVTKDGEVIFSRRTNSATEVAAINRLYATHATCVVTVTYL